jgi:nitrate reductase delta subunit
MTVLELPPVVPTVGRADLMTLCSLLLQYPDAELLAAVPELRAAVDALAADLDRDGLHALVDWLGGDDAVAVQRHYVEVFDLRRRSGLHLTYYLHGDTRKRGLALLTLKQRYRAAGLSLTARELPDFLPVVLEFAAAAGPGAGEAPLRQHRQGLALVAAALRELDSPYAAVLEVVCSVLPPMTEADLAAVAALAADGPMTESVGLEAYAPERPGAPAGYGGPSGSTSPAHACAPARPGAPAGHPSECSS